MIKAKIGIEIKKSKGIANNLHSMTVFLKILGFEIPVLSFSFRKVEGR